MRTHKLIIKSLLDDGFEWSVVDGEEDEILLKPSKNYYEIIEHIESMDCTYAALSADTNDPLLGKYRRHFGWMYIILDNDQQLDFEDVQDYAGEKIENTINKLKNPDAPDYSEWFEEVDDD
ncbi:MAG: hypothetical protein ACPHQD_04795 [Vibrio toranzoniae]|uniref:hypothetical protein n=1 Tax=Vibrio toranzoniae TaxID=1194427 RepID=UPI003C5B4E52